jgi:hypothetical protein
MLRRNQRHEALGGTRSSWRDHDRRDHASSSEPIETKVEDEGNFVAKLVGGTSGRHSSAGWQEELKSAPAGWPQALGRLWGHIMRMDASDATDPSDPLSPLTARLLLEFTEPQEEGAPPHISKGALIELLGDEAGLRRACESLTEAQHELVRNGKRPITPAAAKRLHRLIDLGTTLAFVRVRWHHATGFLPVAAWDSPAQAPTVLRLPGSVSPRELWERAILPHTPCVISGAFGGIVDLCEPFNLANRFGDARVAARRTFNLDKAGRRVFTDQPQDHAHENLVHFGEWLRECGAKSPRAKELYPAKMPLRKALPAMAEHLGSRADTPLARYGACVGALSAGGVHMYAGAGANTTHTHLDPAENFLLVAHGTKRLQLIPPGDFKYIYPFPSPKYHSSAVPPFTDPANCPVEWPFFAKAKPVEVTLEQGDMLYLPAYWYHCVQGGDGHNVVLAWWTEVHERKRDNSEDRSFEPTRRAYAADCFAGVDEGAP